jgi:hypothetical protein
MSRAIDRVAYFQTEELPDRVHETWWQALPLVNTAAAIFDERKIAKALTEAGKAPPRVALWQGSSSQQNTGAHPRRFAEGVHRTAGACRELPSVGAVLEMEKPGCVHVQSVSVGSLLVPVPVFLWEPKLTCTGADCSVLVVRESVLKMEIPVYIGS